MYGSNTNRTPLYFNFLLIAVLLIFIQSCDETYTPKPKGYFRIELPKPAYSMTDFGDCPFSFELPQYAKVSNYKDSIGQPCWKYITFPEFNAEIFLSYKKVENNIEQYLEEARSLAYKHTVKAESIDETIVEIPGKTYAVIYDIAGNAASSVQFIATDSTEHFIRGALYFNVAPQPDSLAPVIHFLRKDIQNIVTSVNWK